MRYLSVCSGIEAASVAWEKLGWTPVAFSEIEPFPAAVLKHRWPEVPNLGDMTKYEEWKLGSIDLLVGGTPCQAFSVAGVRGGLDDPRGGLTLTFVRMADHFNPKWVVWENVPGVLSSKDNAFGCFLGALSGESCELKPTGDKWTDAGCVYGPKRTVVWRCLDAQYFGLAQRRKRVFVVACPRDQGDPPEILLEFEGLRRDTAPSRGSGKETSSDVAGCLRSGGQGGVPSSRGEHLVTTEAFRMQAFGEYSNDDTASTIKARDYKDATDLVTSSVVGALCARDFKGVGNQYVNEGKCLPVTIPIHDQATRHSGKRGDKRDGKGNGLGVGKEGDPCPTLTKGDKHAVLAFEPGIAKREGDPSRFVEELSPTLRSNMGDNQVAAVLYENHPNDSRVTGPLEVAPSCVSRYGTGGGNVPLVEERLVGQVDWRTAHGDGGEVSQTLKTDLAHQSGPCLAVDTYNQCLQETAIPIRSTASDICHTGGVLDHRVRSAVRRLLPLECERLQGFPDNHTLIPWKKKPADQCPDGPRYKALGNSMAVPCMRWIGTRIHNYQERNR